MTDTPGPRDSDHGPSIDDQPLHSETGGADDRLFMEPSPALGAHEEPDEGVGRGGLILALIAILLLVGGGLWWFFGRDTPPPPQVGAEAPPAPLVSEMEGLDEGEEAETVFTDAPPLDESDVWLREAIALITSHPAVAEWLLNDDLVRRGVKVVANVAYDEDPRVHVPFMGPRGEFEVDDGAQLKISSSSYDRYDRLAGAVASVDIEGAGELYRRAAPAAEEAFRELGYPGSFEDALRRALRKVAAVPVLREPPALERKTLSYHYADPELEALAPAQKLMLRMGPDNVRVLQQQAAAFGRTLDS